MKDFGAINLKKYLMILDIKRNVIRNKFKKINQTNMKDVHKFIKEVLGL